MQEMIQEMIQEPLVHGEYKECRCSVVTSLLGSSQGVSLSGNLGLAPWACSRCAREGDFWEDSTGCGCACRGSHLEQDQVLCLERCCTKLWDRSRGWDKHGTRSPQGKKLVLETPSFHIPAGQSKALSSKDHKSWNFGGVLIPN